MTWSRPPRCIVTSYSVSPCLLHTGGRVSFNVGNDSPTLTAAKVTFTIDLEFPHNQKVQPDGDVVWAEDCTVNGNTTRRHTVVQSYYNMYTTNAIYSVACGFKVRY